MSKARCLGLDLLETKLLSNFAAINIMYGRPSEAVSQYLICLQILRGHRDAETYKKVLNFLVITLMRECTWNVAQKCEEYTSVSLFSLSPYCFDHVLHCLLPGPLAITLTLAYHRNHHL
eukprot:413539_1